MLTIEMQAAFDSGLRVTFKQREGEKSLAHPTSMCVSGRRRGFGVVGKMKDIVFLATGCV